MIKLCISFIACFFYLWQLQAQEIMGTFKFFEIDALHNIYLVNNTQIKKYNAQGKFLCEFQDALQGSIATVDVKNPMKILVFYKELSTVVFLDQYLTKISAFTDLYNKTNREPELVCTANDGGLWIYDQIANQVIKVNKNYTVEHQSQNLAGFQLHKPFQLIEKNKTLYLVAHNKTLLFDAFGIYISTIPVAINNEIQIADENKIIWITKHQQINYNQLSKTLDTLPLNAPEDILSTKISGNYIYFLRTDKLQIEKL